VLASHLSETLKSTIEGLSNYLSANFDDYEILIVEDVSLDQIELRSVLDTFDSIRVVQLSFSVEYDIAINVGLENSIGDVVFLFNPELDPIELIDRSLQLIHSDSVDIVVGVSTNLHKSLGYKLIRPVAKKVLAKVGYDEYKNTTTFRCLSRNAVNTVTKARSSYHKLFVRINQSGLNKMRLDYALLSPEKASREFTASIKQTLNILVYNSTVPLRWVSSLGVFGSVIAILFSAYSFLSKLFMNDVADGWSSIIILISFFFLLMFIILSVLGEYLGRLLEEKSPHERYWITQELNSNVMVNEARNNVTTVSVEAVIK
jgi:hypothetical protein